MDKSRIRLVLIDDHDIVRESLRYLLEATRQFVVVGEAGNSRDGVEVTARTRPDVVLVDLIMPRGNGLETLRALKRLNPSPRVIVLSNCDVRDMARECCQAGASGYVLKTTPSSGLFDAIRTAHQGRVIFNRMWPKPITVESVGICCRKHSFRELSARELEVLAFVARGYHNPWIAKELGISVKTVEKHRQAIMDKLNIHETAGITRYALARGLVSCDPYVDNEERWLRRHEQDEMAAMQLCH